MELRQLYIIAIAIFASSCNWFNPYDVPVVEDNFKCVSYFLPIGGDSSLCFLSRSFNPYSPNSNQHLDFCAEVSSSLGAVLSCGEMVDDTSSVWVDTGELNGLMPGDSVFLNVESPSFDDVTSSSIIPEFSEIISYSITPRSFFNGDHYFDEIYLELKDPSPKKEAYMLQLITQVDTLGAPTPVISNIKSDDANMYRRSFGGVALDNALFFDDSFFEGGNYTFLFRTKSRINEGVPFHYTLLVHSISNDMYQFFFDLEASDITGYFNGGSSSVHSNVDGAHGCFGTMQTTPVLLFP
ncbi:MAG: DUF4249 family protein [Bacteroidota bacterium]|nr:DUF4249 family protein [Bacteroidota bacterium]